MKALKSGAAEVEEMWIDVGWFRGTPSGGESFCGNWALPLNNTFSARFPDGPGKVFELGKSAVGGGRRIESVLWFMFGKFQYLT